MGTPLPDAQKQSGAAVFEIFSRRIKVEMRTIEEARRTPTQQNVARAAKAQERILEADARLQDFQNRDHRNAVAERPVFYVTRAGVASVYPDLINVS